jgi:hypothetical protein
MYICSFLDSTFPLTALIEAAKAGNEEGVNEQAQAFTAHANKLGQVCSRKDI